jgi:hypothetical protein
VEHNQVIRLVAYGGSEAPTPAASALVEPAERLERDTEELSPHALSPSRLIALLRLDRWRRHRLRYLSMRTQKRMSWIRSV